MLGRCWRGFVWFYEFLSVNTTSFLSILLLISSFVFTIYIFDNELYFLFIDYFEWFSFRLELLKNGNSNIERQWHQRIYSFDVVEKVCLTLIVGFDSEA